ncbi:MAG: hypothetical protein AABZ33_11160 [Chloroflexota bacterium]
MPAVRRHDDGDWATIPTVEQTHDAGLRVALTPGKPGTVPAVYGPPLDRATHAER